MNMANLLVGLVLGAVAGWLASRIMKSRTSLLWNIVIGVVGGALGSWVARALGIYTVGLASFAVSVAGACLLIFLLRVATGMGKD